MGAALAERQLLLGSSGTLTLQHALERSVGEDLCFEQPRARRLDVDAGIVPCQVRQPVERALSGTTQAGEELPGERCRARADAFSLGEQASALAGRD